MPGVISFNIDLQFTNPELMPELQGRANDLRPAFEVIIEKWATDNKDKFSKSAGMEASGADIDELVFWKALTLPYMTHKRKKGYPDQIMVATGALEAALTNEAGFLHETTAVSALFGTPLEEEDELKAKYNYQRRQTIFLSYDDQLMIEATIKNYFEMGGDFESLLFAQGMENLNLKNEISSMNMEFASMTDGS